MPGTGSAPLPWPDSALAGTGTDAGGAPGAANGRRRHTVNHIVVTARTGKIVLSGSNVDITALEPTTVAPF